MEKEVGIYEAKTHFSKLIDQVQHGQVYVIFKSGVPQAKLIPYQVAQKKRTLGSAKNEFKVPESFFEALPEELNEGFFR